MILQKGNWSDYPCDDRMLRIYVFTIIFAILIFGFLYGVFRLVDAIHLPKGNPEVGIFSNQRKSLIVVVLAGILFLLVLASVPAFSRSMTSLVATESLFIETGCRLRTPYTDTWDRSKTNISYRYSRGKRNFDELYFVQKGKRRIRLWINTSESLSNLIAIAPDAMRDYASQLRSEGKRLPAELERL